MPPTKPDFKNSRRRKVVSPDTARTDRQPPHSAEAEQGVLGCILLAPRECMNQCMAQIDDSSAFYDLRHQTIYEELVAATDQQEPIDIITLQQRLKDKKLLEQIGGIAYLNALQDAVPSAANLSYYIDIVTEKAMLRKMITVCTDAVGSIYEYDGDPEKLVDQVERSILAVRIQKGERRTIKGHVDEAIKHLENRLANGGAISGLSTGLTDLDYYTDGLCSSELIVPAAYPGAGKTSLSMNFAEHAAINCGHSVAVFSQEMTAKQLVLRMMYSNARVNGRRIGRGDMHETDFPKLVATAGKLSKSKLHIIDDAQSIQQIAAEARRLKQEHDIKLVVVDYLQLVTGGGTSKETNREQEVSGVAAALKRLAKELGVPVVAPSQLTDDGKLRESRAIGQHADLIIKLTSEANEGEEVSEEGERVEAFIEKNRNGPSKVSAHLVFLKQYTRFESAAKTPSA
jgi:replicative DNA helicase